MTHLVNETLIPCTTIAPVASVLSIALHMSIDHFCSFVPARVFPQPSILPGRGQTVLGSWGIAVIPLLILCCTPPSLPPFLPPSSHSPSLPSFFLSSLSPLSSTLPPPSLLLSSLPLSFLSPSLSPSFPPSLPPSLSLVPSLPPLPQKPVIQCKRPAGASATDKATPTKRKVSSIRFGDDGKLSPTLKRESQSLYEPPKDRFSKAISNGRFGRGREREGEEEGERNMESLLTFLPITLPLVF